MARMGAIAGGADLCDDTLAAVAHLAGDGALPLLSAAAAAVGAQLGAASITQVDHDPRRHCTVSYQAQLDWADGRRSDELFVATTSVDGPPEGAAVLTSGDLQVGLWRWPFDPCLPGLLDAVAPERLAVRLGHVAPGPWRTSVLSYRPGRRAVVRAECEHRAVVVKLVRPERAAALALRHQRLHAAGVAVPELLAADLDAGFLVLEALEGRTVREVLTDPMATATAPGHDAVDALGELLAAVAPVELDHRPARRSPLGDVTVHARTLVALVPEHTARLERLLCRLAPDEPGPSAAIGAGVTVHGDLHDAQVMVDGRGRLGGLIDLDDCGTGVAADDLGNLWGHAATISLVAPGPASSVWLAGVEQLVRTGGCDTAQVARRAAAVALSLATGPFRVRDHDWVDQTVARLAIAERLIERGTAS
jgi:aminoglycoside phosphotransferase (APT) family kinase protein